MLNSWGKQQVHSGYMITAMQRCKVYSAQGVWTQFDMNDVFWYGSSSVNVNSHRTKKKMYRYRYIDTDIDQGICQTHCWERGVGRLQLSRKHSAIGLRCYLRAFSAFTDLMLLCFFLGYSVYCVLVSRGRETQPSAAACRTARSALKDLCYQSRIVEFSIGNYFRRSENEAKCVK